MMIELPETLESALKVHANALGVSPDSYVQEILKRDLASALKTPAIPFKTGYASLAKYGVAPSEAEIDANRAEMFRSFGQEFE